MIILPDVRFNAKSKSENGAISLSEINRPWAFYHWTKDLVGG